MKSNWVTYTISDVAQRVITGKTPPGTRDEYFGGETLFVTPTDMEDDKHITETIRTLSISGEEKLKKQMFTKGVVVSCIGWQMGKSAIVTQTAVTNQQVNTVVPDENIIDLDFLYYVLKSKREEIFNLGATATRTPILKKSLFEKISFNAPCLIEQKKISRLLSKLDDKIRLNTQTNQTLEETAQAIFKSWFVDFDPVKAKINGEQPKGMDAATASLFPEKLVESELGLIPDGWEVKPFSEWVKITKGKNITKKTIVDGDVPVVAGGLKPAYFHNAHNVDGPAITISASGANAGYVNLYFENIWASDCSYISQSTTPLFFLQYVALRYNQKKIFDMQTGAAQPHIYPRDFERLMIVVPNKELCRKLEEVFASFFEIVANNKQQNIELAALRDTLLPKLLSGEIELAAREGV